MGRTLASAGHDVWLVEITGGPGQDCETCPNYTWGDVTEHYWPALAAGISAYTGEPHAHYVGHSNGCRSALASLNLYSNDGKDNAGEAFNYTNGSYYSTSLPANYIQQFFGIGCPIILNEETTFTETTRYNDCDDCDYTGNNVINTLREDGKTHLRLYDYHKELFFNTPIHPEWSSQLEKIFVLWNSLRDHGKISLSLMEHYNELSINSSSTFNVSSVNVTNLTLFNGQPDDVIVPYEDAEYTNNSIPYNVIIISIEKHDFSEEGTHIVLAEDAGVINNIVEALKNEP